MKVIRKSDMLRSSQEAHLRAERDFLVAAEHSRWIVPLVAAFQDKSSLYLVMDYMVGGDFLGLLLREDVLDEDVARWYIAEMILCVEEAHKMGWVHRDVKPDNFLISSSGHLKISDFGLAFDGHWRHSQSYFIGHRASIIDRLKMGARKSQPAVKGSLPGGILRHAPVERPCGGGKDGRMAQGGLLQWRERTGRRNMARSIVGTSQYMAPEVIMGEPYDGRCD